MSGRSVLETSKTGAVTRVSPATRAFARAGLAALFLLGPLARTNGVHAQDPPRPFTLDQVMSYPFPEHLVAAPAGARIAWTFNERGVRNIYTAAAPDFSARRITPYTNDDGQELTGLTFSDDGRTIVYVRGGDHDANWQAAGGFAPDPSSSPMQPRVQVWAVGVDGGAPRLIGDGDDAAVAPKTHRVAFVRDGRIWIAPLDGAAPAESFFVRGNSRTPAWSPDGRTLAFVSDRGDHSFIALFTDTSHPIRYIAPATSVDSLPAWSPDGTQLLFVREPGRGGVPSLDPPPVPWSLWVADATSETAHEVWKSGRSREDSYATVSDALDPQWAADGRIVFMSYADGWPHLYSVPSSGGAPLRLTSGAFMVEHAQLSPDRRAIVYSANTGSDARDGDRRHIFRVPVDAASPAALTEGDSIAWTPVVTSDGQFVVCLLADARRPPLPAAIPAGRGAVRPIAADRLPQDFPSARLVTPEPVVFKSTDGLELHGQLFKTTAGPAKRPALVYVHGGPPRQMLLGWHYMGYYSADYATNQYLASRGFIVLSVNYRLGIGYGYAFHHPEHAGARGASEYHDVLAAGEFLRRRADVNATHIGIWGGSYGGFLTALALGRNSDVFAAGVDIHGVHDLDRQRRGAPNLTAALAGDGITQDDLQRAARVTYESSPISSVGTWRSPVLLIHGDDDRNVDFHQTVDLRQRLDARGVDVEELVIPDDIHDFLLWRSWRTVAGATAAYLEKKLLGTAAASPGT